jgi:hypothetical protein
MRVLWNLWTMPNRLTNFTPFFMVYGLNVVLPTKLQYGSPWSRPTNRLRPSKHDKTSLTYLKNRRTSLS